MKTPGKCAKALCCVALAAIPLWLVVSAAVFVLSWTGLLPRTTSGRQRAFERFLGPSPSSVSLVEYGYDRDASGHGCYALLFQISEPELRELMKKGGFTPTEVGADADHWRPELCNSVIKRLTKVDVPIETSFLCFMKKGQENSSRVFYNPKDSRAIFLGFGRYAQ